MKVGVLVGVVWIVSVFYVWTLLKASKRKTPKPWDVKNEEIDE